MISGGNTTVYVADMDEAIQFYTERLGLTLTNRFGRQWATVETGPSYWTTDEVGAGLTIGLHPPSAKAAAPGTKGGVGFGLETYAPIDDVVKRLGERGVRVDAEVVTFEAGKVASLVDQDGLPTYVWEFTAGMLAEANVEGSAGEAGSGEGADMIAGGHAIVYVSDMDAAIRFYTKTLGLKLTNRFGNSIAFAEAGRLVLAIHPKTPNTPSPGERGSVMLGLTIDEPIDQVLSHLTARGVRITGSITRSGPDNFVELEDPDGNPIYLWEPARKEEPRREAHVPVKA
jgi:catechol 2,3-dioxygenase-like lactoylglutathione lyase family enzyme